MPEQSGYSQGTADEGRLAAVSAFGRPADAPQVSPRLEEYLDQIYVPLVSRVPYPVRGILLHTGSVRYAALRGAGYRVARLLRSSARGSQCGSTAPHSMVGE